MKKIFNVNSSCGFWSPGKSVKGKTLNVQECWACRFCLTINIAVLLLNWKDRARTKLVMKSFE
jgi:hypothetical protein